VRPGDVPFPRRDDRSDGAKFLREQMAMEIDLEISKFQESQALFRESIGRCVSALAAFTDAWGEMACLDPNFSDEDQDVLVSLGMTRGW
jgi:hypothetical protein